ncbi:hypothetical protein J7M02_07970, partial [Candidatus Aerophobetes bacterium]|nr:hypothetical protein [Candidatus Aerophobetes bacterium]
MNKSVKGVFISTFLIVISIFLEIVIATYANEPYWTKITGPWGIKFDDYFNKVTIDQSQGIIYVGNGIGAGVYKSIDNGKTWKPINNGLPTIPLTSNYFPVIDIIVSKTSAETMYLTMQYKGVFKWNGINWVKRNGKRGIGGLTKGTALPQGEHYILAIDSNDDNLIFAGTDDGPYKSIDGGKNWEPINEDFSINPVDGSRSDINEIIRSTGTLYAISNDIQGHGVYKSIGNGENWQIIGSPEILKELRDLSIRTLAALIGRTLEPFTFPTTMYTCLAINSKTNILYVGTSKEGIYRFNETTKKWSLANNGLPFNSKGYFPIKCIVIDSLKPNIIYIGTWGGGVYKSDNGGDNWSPLNKGLEGSKVKSLALDSQHQTLYAATTNGLFKCTLGRVEEAHPVITSPLKITSSPPYYVGDKINAEFTIANVGTMPIILSILTVGGRDPDNQVADFTHRKNITLQASESYHYKGTLTLTKAGKYHFFCAYRTADGKWNPSIDLALGLTDEDRIENIIVKAKEKNLGVYY